MYNFYGYFIQVLVLVVFLLPFYVYWLPFSRMLQPPGLYQYGYINRFFGYLASEWVQPVGGFTSNLKLYEGWSQCFNSVSSLLVILLGFGFIPQSMTTISFRWLIPQSHLFQILVISDSPLISWVQDRNSFCSEP